MRFERPDYPGTAFDGRAFLLTDCPYCGSRGSTQVAFRALQHPVGRRFWHAHPRIALLPERVAETAAGPTLIVGFQDTATAARFTGMLALNSLRLIGVDSDTVEDAIGNSAGDPRG